MKKPLSIIIPVYNEGEIILKTLSAIETNITIPHSIRIIYDYDEDNTLPVVLVYLKKFKQTHIALIRNNYGRGALNAIKTGFDTAQEEAVLVVMADLSDDLSIVDEMYRQIEAGYDIVCGSRYMKGGKHIGGSIIKKTLSSLAGLSLHLLTGIPTHDVSNSFKMYRRRVLENMVIESNGGFEIGMEILVKSWLKGFRVTELPSVWRDRTSGESNFKLWAWLPKYLKWYLLLLKGKARQ